MLVMFMSGGLRAEEVGHVGEMGTELKSITHFYYSLEAEGTAGLEPEKFLVR